MVDELATAGATARLSLLPGGKERGENFLEGTCDSEDMEEEEHIKLRCTHHTSGGYAGRCWNPIVP